MGDFEDAISILEQYYFPEKATHLVSRAAEGVYPHEGLRRAIDILRKASKKDIKPRSEVIDQAIEQANSMNIYTNRKVVWDGYDILKG